MSGTDIRSGGVGVAGLRTSLLEDLAATQGAKKGGGQTAVGGGTFIPTSGGDAGALGMRKPMLSTYDMGDIMTLVLAIKQKTDQAQLNTTKTEVQGIKQQKEQAADDRIDKLKESQDKASDAKKSGKIGEIFGWIAAAAMTIAGAIMVATGVGAAAGVALLAGGITMLTMMTLQSDDLGKAVGLKGSMMSGMIDGIADSLVQNGLISPDQADKAKMIATAIITSIMTVVAMVAGTVAGGPFLGLALASQTMAPLFTPENLKEMGVPDKDLMAASIGISVGLAVVGFASGAAGSAAAGAAGKVAGGAEDVGKIAQLLAKVPAGAMGRMASSAAEAAKLGAEGASIGAKIAAYTTALISALGVVGQGSAQIGSAVITKQSEDLRADSKDLEAFISKMQQYFQDQSDRLDEILKRMQDNVGAVMDIINQTGAVGEKIARINTV